ncbi:hypothetical protein EON63_16900, partial [archaeon]
MRDSESESVQNMSTTEIGKCAITIVVDGEDTMYSGGHVSGVASLQIQRNTVDADALRIRLLGAEELAYETIETTSGGQKMTSQTKFHLVCCDEKSVISFEPGGLAIGSYDYPFYLSIPANIPGSQLHQQDTTIYGVVYTLELSLENKGVVFNSQTFKFYLPIRCMPTSDQAITKVPYVGLPRILPVSFAICMPMGQMTIEASLDTVEVKRGESVTMKCSIVSNTSCIKATQYSVQIIRTICFPDDFEPSPLSSILTQHIYPIPAPSTPDTTISIPIPMHFHPCYKCRVCTMGYM